MEGTRHERAALVGVAYFLGFLTTFIWLGYNSVATSTAPTISAVSQPAAALSAVTETTSEAGSQDQVAPGVVTYTNGVLEVSALGGSRTLSFNVEGSEGEVATEFAKQGTHVGTLAYVASPTAEYVFFCEQKSQDANTCSPFVYDVLSDTIYRVTKDGDRVDLLTGAAKAVTWSENSLIVGEETSASTAKPWALGN